MKGELKIALSRRERQVEDLLIQGKSHKEIAYLLGRSQFTIETQYESIFRKRGVHSLGELILAVCHVVRKRD